MADMDFDPTSVRRKIVAGDIDEAEQSLARAVDDGVDHSVVAELRGAVAYRRGETQAALDHADRALGLDAALVPAHVLRIKALSRLGKHTLAVEHCDVLLTIDSGDSEVLSTTARVYQKAEFYDAAAQCWLKLAAQRPDDVAVRARAIETLELSGLHREAIDHSLAVCTAGLATVEMLERCLSLALRWGTSDDVGAALAALADTDLGRAFENVTDLAVAGRFADAAWLIRRGAAAGLDIHPALAASLSRSIVSQAKDAEVRGDMMVALAAWGLVDVIGSDDRAAPRLEKAGIAVSKAAVAAFADGRSDEAAAQIAALVHVWPTARACSAQATIAKAREDWDALSAACGELAVLSDGPERADAITRSIRALRKSKNFVGSLTMLTRISAPIGPNDEIEDAAMWVFDKLRRQVRDDLKAGAIPAADAGYRALLAWDPHNPEIAPFATALVKAYSAATSAARRAGDTPTAIAAAQRLIELVPDKLDALKFLADHSLKHGQHIAAVRLYERVIALAPDEHRYLYKIGRAYRSIGDYERGMVVMLRFLEVEPEHKSARELLNEIIARHTA